MSAKRKLKKNRPSWLVSKHCYDVDSSEAESSSEEDEKVSASEEEAVTETESANEIQENVESSYSDFPIIVQQMRRRGWKVQGSLNLRLGVRPSPNQAKRRRRTNKRNKSLSEEEMERFPFLRWAPTHFASIFKNALDLFTLSLPLARHVLHGV